MKIFTCVSRVNFIDRVDFLFFLLLSITILFTGCEVEEIDFVQPKPVAMEADEISSTGFLASWQPVLGSSLYLLDVSTSPDFSSFVGQYQSKEVEGTFIKVEGLEIDQTYYYRVRAKRESSFSDNSNVVSVVTTLLGIPEALSASEINPQGFTAHWTMVEEATVYLLDIATDEGFSDVSTREVTDTLFVLSDLTAQTDYYYRVRAKRENVSSSFSNIVVVNTEPLPVPVALSPSALKVFNFTASWNSVSEATSYLVDVAIDSSFTTFHTGYDSKEVVDTTLLISGLDYRETYYYRVRTKRLDKVSDYSNVVEVQPCISQSCKLKRFTYNGPSDGNDVFRTYNFTYNDDGQLTEILYDYVWEFGSGVFNRFELDYNENDKISIVRQYDGSDVFEASYELNYNEQNQLTSLQFFGATGSPGSIRNYIYDDSGLLMAYRRFSGADTLAYEDYTLDERGNVLESRDAAGELIWEYRYEDGFNPKKLIPNEISVLIRDEYSAFSLEAHTSVNNPTYAKSSTSEEVFIYDYNEKEIATVRKGFFDIEYEFEGCDF